MNQISVLFVCLGNICRSPLAEAVFNHKIRRHELAHVFVADSCGTSNYHIGQQPDPRTLSNARRNGIAIDHSGRQLSESDLERFDYILAADSSNLSAILKLSNAAANPGKIMLMRDFDPLAKGSDVPDPYFGGDDGFQDVYEILDRTLDAFISHLRAVHVPGR